MQAFNAFVCSTIHVAHAHGRRGSRWADEQASIEDMKRKVPETMTAGFQLIEKIMLKGPFVLGARYSVADAYLHTMARWLEGDGVDINLFPRVKDHFDRMSEMETVRRALAEV
jgi:glutathione S-transferase